MVDLDALEAAGLANARERADLINYLDSLGFTVEEMVEAERRGRLFGLSGDAVRRTGRPTHSLRTAAEALGLPLDDTAHFWTTLGLSVPNPDDVVLSQVDVDALATCADMRQPKRHCFARRGPTSGSPAATMNSPLPRPGAKWPN